MPLQILENPSASGRALDSLGAGLASGLQALASHKLQEVQRGKIASEFQKGFNVHPDLANSMAMLYQSNPKEFTNQFHHYLQNIGGGTAPGQQLEEGEEPKYNTYQPGIGGAKSEAQQLQVQKYKDKAGVDLAYLDDLESTVDAMIDLAEKGGVEFGKKSALKAAVPVVGAHYLDEPTGTFHHLSNKFVTDAAQKATGVRSVYHIKALAASKAGLDKTKDQNLQVLRHWKKTIDRKKDDFYKEHSKYFSRNDKKAENVLEKQETKQKEMPQAYRENGKIYFNGQEFEPIG